MKPDKINMKFTMLPPPSQHRVGELGIKCSLQTSQSGLFKHAALIQQRTEPDLAYDNMIASNVFQEDNINVSTHHKRDKVSYDLKANCICRPEVSQGPLKSVVLGSVLG